MKSLFIFIFAISFIGCDNDDHKNLDLLFQLNKSLDNSNALIAKSNTVIYQAFLSRLEDPMFGQMANRWFPAAELVKASSDSLIESIVKLETDLKRASGLDSSNSDKLKLADTRAVEMILFKTNQGEKLRRKIKSYNVELLNNQEAREYIGKKITEILEMNDSANSKKEYWDNLFKEKSAIASLTILNRIKNSILLVENNTMDFFYGHTSGCIYRYNKLGVLVNQSSKIVIPGDKIVIEAGVGEFDAAAKPSFQINGKHVGSNGDAHLYYTIKTSLKPGEYCVPVNVEFTRQDGTKINIEKTISYTVFDTTKH